MMTSEQREIAKLARERALIVSDALQDAGFDVGTSTSRGRMLGKVSVRKGTASMYVYVHEFQLATVDITPDGYIMVHERRDLVALPNGHLDYRSRSDKDLPQSGTLVEAVLRKRGLGQWMR